MLRRQPRAGCGSAILAGMTTSETSLPTERPPLAERALSQRVRDVPPSGIRRFFDILATMDDVISLGVGEPDFDTPPDIVEAGVASLLRGRTHYTSNYGTIELRRALAAHLDGRYGVRYDPATEILVTVGASEAVDLALRATCDPGDEVILHEPSYVAYVPAIAFAGGSAVPGRDPARGRLRARSRRRRGGHHAADQGALPGLPLQPDRCRAARRGPGRAGRDRRPPRPAGLQRRDLRPPGLRLVPSPGDVGPAGHARTDDPDRRLLEGLRHDRLAGRLRVRPGRDPRGHRQGPPVRDHVGADDRPGRRPRGAAPRRVRGPADAGRVRPSPAAAGRRAQRDRPAHVRAARRVLRLPRGDLGHRADLRAVHRAAAPRGAGRGRPRQRLRGVRRGPRPDVLRHRLRADRGGAPPDRGALAGSAADSWSAPGSANRVVQCDGEPGRRQPGTPPRRSSASSIAQIASGRRYRLAR